MRVSIITVCYNSATTIATAIQSVKSQQYNNIEHIIIDGKSTDTTLEVIKQSSFNGLLLSEKDNGIYDAMNKGIKMASGDVIAILNSDDYYANNFVITDVVKHMQSSKSDALYGDLHYVNEHDKIVRNWRSGQFDYKKFNYGWMPPHPTVFVKREVYTNLGFFKTNLRVSADYELMLRFLFVNKIKTSYLPQVLVKMKTGGISNGSLKNRLLAHKEDYLAWTSNGIIPHWYTIMLKPLRKVLQYNKMSFTEKATASPSSSFKSLSPSTS